MVRIQRRLACFGGGVVLAAAMALSTPGGVVASGGSTCVGGPVAGGTYSSLTVAGICAMAAGNVNVTGSLTIQSGGLLVAAFGGSDVSAGSIFVQPGGMLILGCEPFAFPCVNDPHPETGGTLSAGAVVKANFVAEGALAEIVHNTVVGNNLVLSGGGGGVNCDPNPVLTQLAGFPLPLYATFEDVDIRGNASISGWRSCWLGFIRNTVGQNVNFNDNLTADPDSSEVVANAIHGNLNCAGNSPNPQIGDSGGSLNTVAGRANGQCAHLA